jgi:excisionase family DNA binding protein
MKDQRLVTIQEAMQMARVGRRTIYNWLKAGKLETVRTAGGSLRIVVSSLWRPSGVNDNQGKEE